jgi:hypothetical protein
MFKMTKTILLLLICNALYSQGRISAGFRFSPSIGLSLKVNSTNKNSQEYLLTRFGKGFTGTFLFQKHYNSFSSPSWRWFWGLGGHFGATSIHERNKFEDTKIDVGGDGIIGLEYTFRKFPLNGSVDWKPKLDILYGTESSITRFGLSTRYIIR